jgi:plastocyanin
MRAPLALLLVLALAALSACGGGGSSSSGASSSTCPKGAAVIKMKDIKFDPETTTAGVGQQICWINEDTIEHDAVADSGASFKSELFGKGQTFTATVDKPGTVKYECTVHPGMKGEITVERR